MFSSSADFLDCLSDLPSPSVQHREAALSRQNQLTKPGGALGRLEALSVFLAGWQRQERLQVEAVEALLFAGNHGVVVEGVSPYPPEVTAQMVANFERGGAAINALARLFGHRLQVVPLELDRATGNIAVEPAMSEAETLAALNAGAEAVMGCEADMVYFGEMGIGNTTSAAAIAAAVFGGDGGDWAGPGTGLDSDGVRHKAAVIDRALRLHRDEIKTPFDALQRLGGRELAAIMGGVVAARRRSLPVLLDGYVVTAAVCPLAMIGPEALEHCLAAHRSAEPGHRRLLDELWMDPLLALDMRLGEGTGAALAVNLLMAAAATYNDMATFEEAAVAGR